MGGLTRATLRRPARAVLLLAAATLVLATGLPRLRTEFGYLPLIGAEHPAIRSLEEFVERFGGGFPVQIAWACGPGLPCEDALDPASLEMADFVATMLAAVPGVRSLEGPSSSPVLVAEADGFSVRRLVEHGRIPADHAALAARAAGDPQWSGRLVSADRRAAMIVLQLEDASSATSSAVVEALLETLEPFEARGFEFHLAGHAVEFVIAGRELADSSAALVPVTSLVVFAILLLLGRSWLGAAHAMATMALGLVWTTGLLGLLGWPQDSILQTLAPLILVVGVCDAVHLTSRARRELSGAAPGWAGRCGAVGAAAADVGPACLVTTTTTAAALVSFASSDLRTFVHFGIVASAGVVFCLLLTFSALPLLLAAWPPKPAAADLGLDRALRAIGELALRRRGPILAVTAVAALAFGAAWAVLLRVDTDGYEMYGEHSRIIRWVRFVEDHFQRADALELEITLPAGVELADPATLAAVSALSGWLGDAVGPAHSVVDLVARLHRILREDRPDFERPADTTAGNAQLLALLSFEHRSLLDRWISVDRRRLRISVEAPFSSYADRRALLARLDRAAVSLLPPGFELRATGPFAIGVEWVEAVQSTQLRSFAGALALVFLLVALHLRSLRLAVVAMVPAVLPVVLTLGGMGLLGLRLDVGRAMIAAVILGIAVDDAVHLLGQVRRRTGRGVPLHAAIVEALAHTGPALVATSLSLAAGFLTLLVSPWQTVSSFGFFVALAILVGLAATLLVLPALLAVLANLGRLRVGGARLRRWAPVAMLVPPLLALGTALGEHQGNGGYALPCWVAPNGYVLAGAAACRLPPDSALRGIEVAGEVLGPGDLARLPALLAEARGRATLRVAGPRGGSVELLVPPRPPGEGAARLSAAALLVSLLLAVPVTLAWRSRSRAAVPFGLFYSVAAVVGVAALCGRGSPALQRQALVALSAAPALLVHLGLTFPRERPVVRAHPALLGAPYASIPVLLALAGSAFERSPLLAPAAVVLLAGLCAGAWLILVGGCGFALREADTLLQRTRARLLCYGSLLAPALLALLAARALGAGTSALAASALLAALLPLPIGLSISRYNLFDLGLDTRRALTRLARAGFTAAVLTAAGFLLSALPGALDAPRFFAVALSALVLIDPLERWLGGRLACVLAPRGRRLDALASAYSRAVSELCGPDQIADRLGGSFRAGLEPRFAAIFLRAAGGYRLAYRYGPLPAPAAALCDESAARLGRVRICLPLQEAAGSGGCGSAPGLVVAIDRGDDRLGIAVLGAPRVGAAYTSEDASFASTLAVQTGLALHNAALARDLASRERDAATGRIALALAHDLGKQLDWTRKLAERLPARLSEPERLRRDLGSLAELARDMAEAVRGFVREGAVARRAGTIEVDRLVDSAVAAVSRIHPGASISSVVEPSARRTRVPEPTEWVLVNLLENAVYAEPAGGSVHVFASHRPRSVRLSVRDHGCGPPGDAEPSWFRVGFTTRGARGGQGMGLPVCRDLAESLGGALALERGPSGGTTAVLTVPAAS